MLPAPLGQAPLIRNLLNHVHGFSMSRSRRVASRATGVRAGHLGKAENLRTVAWLDPDPTGLRVDPCLAHLQPPLRAGSSSPVALADSPVPPLTCVLGPSRLAVGTGDCAAASWDSLWGQNTVLLAWGRDQSQCQLSAQKQNWVGFSMMISLLFLQWF